MHQGLFLSWLVLSISFWLTSALLPGFQVKGGIWGIVKIAALFGVLQVLLGKIIFVIIGISTLGIGFILAFITRWFVSAILLKLLDAVSETLEIVSFGRAFLGAMLMSGIGTIAEALLVRGTH